jgi:hypothetical protein
MAIGEVLYYFRLQVEQGETHTLAAIVPFGQPDDFLLAESSNTVYSCKKGETVMAIDVKRIRSVVGMLPHRVAGEDQWFLVEKPGLDVWDMGGFEEEMDDGDQPDQGEEGE